MTEHPLIRLQADGDCQAYRLSDATSMRSFRRSAVYVEFFGPGAIGHDVTSPTTSCSSPSCCGQSCNQPSSPPGGQWPARR